MNPAIHWLNDFSSPWAAWIWRATWQAAIVVAIAWILTVVIARRSSRFRSWIWRLAYIKLLILLIWTTPLRLAVLPAEAASQESQVRSRESQVWGGSDSPPISTELKNQIAEVAPRSAEPQTSDLAIAPPMPDSRLPTPDSRSLAPDIRTPVVASQPATQLAWQSWLLSAWLIGLAAVVVWLAWAVSRAVKLWRSARAIDRPDLDRILQDVRRDLKLRSQAQLTQSDLAAGPMLVKFLRPRIIFPVAMVDQLSPDEIRLVLAHELAHIKRRDLAWNALAAVVHIALYFHPLVWFAHRLSRREQELTCDELVVTRLAVERHDYGQMLVNVVRQISWNFTTGIATVGMSGSYRTLSRRLEAMKTTRQFTSKQIAAAAISLALLAAISIVPWRLVAQERPVANPARPAAAQDPRQPAAPARAAAQAAPGSAASQTISERGPREQPSQEELIVGTWRGNSTTGELVVNRDGTYQQFLRIQNVGTSPQCVNEHGQWQIQDGMLTLTAEAESLAMRGLPTVDIGPAGAIQHQLRIVRLDDNLLRLQGFFVGFEPAFGAFGPDPSSSPVVFFRRVDPKAAPPEYDPSLPPELKQVAEAARLSPKDALKMAGWFPRDADPQTGGALRWDLVARIVKARRGQIDFAELFSLTADEAKAYLELLKLAGNYRSACTLADDGQLAPQELNAVHKLQAFDRDLTALAASLDWAILNAAKGSGVSAITAENAETLGLKDEFEAKMKLSLFLDELFSYVNYTVFGGGLFGQPPAMGAAPAAVGAGASDPAGVGPGAFRPPAGDHE